MDGSHNITNGGTLFSKEIVLSLSGEIAHELRTPLAVIQLYTELMEGMLERDNSNNFSNYSKVIKRTVKETNYFIDSFLLQIRYISNGNKATCHRKWRNYSMRQSLKETIKNYPFREGERTAINLSIKGNFNYRGEKILVVHVLNNLLKNALAALKEQAKPGSIDIICSRQGQEGMVTVTDNAGMLDAKLSRKIFKQFTGKNASYKNGGIGLHFCHLVMKNLGGSITCKTRPGYSTSFILHFPLA